MANDEIIGEAEIIAASLERLARLLRGEQHSGGLNPAQWEALRYLARANRFSNSPGALTRYLGATKGTVSQSLMALERKGLISKTKRPDEKRSVSLALTPAGEALLAQDRWAGLHTDAAALGDKTRRRTAKGLRELLEAELKRGGHAAFGQCETCRFFREKGASDSPAGPHKCMLLDAPLSGADAAKICVEHEAAA